jgi:hypothetical protein
MKRLKKRDLAYFEDMIKSQNLNLKEEDEDQSECGCLKIGIYPSTLA